MIFTIGLSSRFPVDQTIDTVEMLDRVGISSVLFEDEATYYNVYTLLALAAKRTNNILIGPGVTNPLTRHPVITASAIATIDEISSGRALLGLGAGGTATMVALGVDVKRPVTKLKTVVPVVRRLLNGESVTIADGPYNMQEVHLGISPRREIPIYIAGRGPRILQAGGFLADGVIAGAGLFTPTAMEYARNNIMKGAKESGRDFKDIDIVAWAYTSVSEAREKAIEPVARFAYLTVRSAPIEVWQPTGLDISFAEKIKQEPIPESNRIPELTPHSVIDQFGLSGAPSECRKRIHEMAEAGIDHLGLLIFPVQDLGLRGTTDLLVESVLKEFLRD